MLTMIVAREDDAEEGAAEDDDEEDEGEILVGSDLTRLLPPGNSAERARDPLSLLLLLLVDVSLSLR